MKRLLFFLPLILLVNCSKNKEAKNTDDEPRAEFLQTIQSDTLKESNYIAVFDDKTGKKTNLSDSELKIVNKNLIKAVNEYNHQINHQDKSYKLNLRNYFRQYFVSINSNGEKIVKIFCFCEYSDDIWRTGKIDVHDGGKCYFNVIINIKKQNHTTLITHGLA